MKLRTPYGIQLPVTAATSLSIQRFYPKGKIYFFCGRGEKCVEIQSRLRDCRGGETDARQAKPLRSNGAKAEPRKARPPCMAGSLSNNKSTGKESRAEAEKVVMEWVVKGVCPKRVSKKGNSKASTSFDTISFMNQLKMSPFTDSDVDQIISILKERDFIKTAIRVATKADRDARDFLLEFWEEVSKKHGLDRGSENSRMKHSELKNYRAVLRSKEKAMEIQRELYQENKAKLDCIYRSANRVFDEKRKKEWKSKGDIPEELPKTRYDESADSYRLRISPHIHSFYEKCRNVFSRNQKLESVMGKEFSVEISGKRYRFNRGLVHAFKNTLYHLNRMFGVSPEQFGGVQILASDNSQNYDDRDFMDEPEVRNHRRYVAEMERD